MMITKLIKHLYARINMNKNEKRWKSEFNSLKLAAERETVKVLEKQEGKILLLVPHADDELLAAYELTKTEDVLLCYCGFTGENLNENNRIRRKEEYQNYVSCVDAKTVFSNDLVQELPDLIQKHQIKTLVLPSIVDWHFEHRLVNYLAKSACERAMITPDILWYTVTIPFVQTDRRVLLMTIEQQEEKYNVFRKVYLSQAHMPLERFKLLERLAGMGAGGYAAESFLPLSYTAWSEATMRVQRAEGMSEDTFIQKIKGLKMMINSLCAVRQASAEIYAELLDSTDKNKQSV